MPNRLASEQSPYLLQHQHNPVDWFPWGDEAFARARAEDKPIFLSIGYSTCHWCHVMEHESFENAEVAAMLNKGFVSIKVDREERPDVDQVYMAFVQATTGSGGWPMSVWLTPSLEPFYGGTYYPPSSRWGRPGFTEVLEEISRVWREERPKVVQSAATIVERLRSHGTSGPGVAPPLGPEPLDATVEAFTASFDPQRGGFGTAPKFPRPSELLFLFREYARTGAIAPRDMALTTLRAIALGGMRDHLGGGFHRYSVDGNWRVPHFEKMLYDQAQLTLAYLEATQITGDPSYADVATDTLGYVLRDLTDVTGAFYSAEDADSVPPEAAGEPHPQKKEGAFYVWTDEEVGDVLGNEAGLFRLRFGVVPGGNAPSDPQEEFTNKNLLFTANGIEEIASETGTTPQEVLASLQQVRERLLAQRNTRPRPQLDDKILTAWNGLMIAAFARAGRVVHEGAPFVVAARRSAMFMRTQMWDPSAQILRRRSRHGHIAVDGYAEDYAFLIFGLLELFQSDGDAEWLQWALTLQQRQDELFWDAAGGGWFSTTGQDASVLLRLKTDYDGAEPAPTSMSLFNLLTLSHLSDDPALADRLQTTLAQVVARLAGNGRAAPMLLAGASTYLAGMVQIVLVGERDDPQATALAEVVRGRYLPNAVTIRVDSTNRDSLVPMLPWIAAMGEREGSATAYVCRQFACLEPATSAERLAAQLDRLVAEA